MSFPRTRESRDIDSEPQGRSGCRRRLLPGQSAAVLARRRRRARRCGTFWRPGTMRRLVVLFLSRIARGNECGSRRWAARPGDRFMECFPMRIAGIGVGCALAISLATAPLAAQSGGVLSLEEALELARQNNPLLRQAMNELELTPAGMRAAWGAFLPSFSLSLGTNVNLNRRLQAEDFFGNPIANPNVEWVTASSSSQSVSADLHLFEGGVRFHQRGAERARGIARERKVEAEMIDTWTRVATSFYETIRQSDLLELEMAILEGKRRDLESTRRLFELAVGTRVDILAAELEVQQQERAVRQAENEHAKAVLGLRAEIVAPGLGEFTTRGTLPQPFDPAALDVAGLIGRALEQSPLIQQDRAEVEVSRASLSVARSARLPTISLGTYFFQNAYGPEYTAAFKPFSNDSRYASARLSLSIPVFTGFSTERDIAVAQVELANAEEQVRQTLLEIDRDVRSPHH